MQVQCWGSNMLEVAEDASRFGDFEYFLVERPLPGVCHVMDRKARDHGIEQPHRWQWLLKVVVRDRNAAIAIKPFVQFCQHGRGKIKRYEFRIRPDRLYQFDQPSSPCTQVKNPSTAEPNKL